MMCCSCQTDQEAVRGPVRQEERIAVGPRLGLGGLGEGERGQFSEMRSQQADRSRIRPILEVAAIAHGEWVRIQPLANGNGRIARLWVNWVAVRYGLPFFLALKPRPANRVYAAAAAASMRGDHHPRVVAILTLLNQDMV